MLQKVKNRLKDQRGLTLIELLAVIVILGIIAAIAVPSIMNVIDKSKEDAIKSDAIQIINGAKLYIASENVDDGEILWTTDNLDSYVDITSGTTVGAIEGETEFLVTIGADNSITLSGTLKKDGKLLTLTNAGLNEIKTNGTGVAITAAE
ncbi:MAG: type IV pilin protein [Bacillota bacterium]